jgi:hypothetical protein
MQPQHTVIAAALVEQRQADLRHQADRWCLAHSARADRPPSHPANRLLLDLVRGLVGGGAAIANWTAATRRRLRQALAPPKPLSPR